MKLDLVLQRVRARATRRRARGGGARSPPPEPADVVDRLIYKHRHRPDKWAHVPAQVDTSAPALRPPRPASAAPLLALRRENMMLLAHIRDAHYSGGRVDCWRRAPPARVEQYQRTRVDFAARVHRENRRLHRQFTTAGPRLPKTAELERWWAAARHERERRARGPWLLAPRVQQRDPAFDAPPGVRRPTVCLQLGVRGGAALGTLRLELFAETCPRSAALFLALLAARPGYVGTRFYRKVPGLYWSGGDVLRDCGLGRPALPPPFDALGPMEPENFHYPHSSPGLLTMHVDADGEVCGSFSVTFKPLLQFDLRSVVFGRVLFPSRTFEAMRSLGAALSSQPVVVIRAARAAAPPAPARARASSPPAPAQSDSLTPGECNTNIN